MKTIIFVGLCLIHTSGIYAQTADSITKRAFFTISVGLTYRPLKFGGLNALLEQGHYPRINTDWAMFNLSREIESIKAPEWSSRLSIAYGEQRREKNDPKSVAASLVQISMGLGYKVIERKKISLTIQTGIEFFDLNVDCYDRLVDTTNLSGYIISQSSDSKMFGLGQVCIRTGCMFRLMPKDGPVVKILTGYYIPCSNVSVGHYRGSFGHLSETRIGGFYCGVELGVAGVRCQN